MITVMNIMKAIIIIKFIKMVLLLFITLGCPQLIIMGKKYAYEVRLYI